MNWMIDGANGDLYRTTMNYPALTAARDEWEVERRIGKPRRSLLRRLAIRLVVLRRTWANHAAADTTTAKAPVMGGFGS